MRSQKDVAWRAIEKCIAAFESGDRVFVCAELEGGRGDRRQAVGVDEVQTTTLFAGLPCPAGSSWSMPGGEMRGDRDAFGQEGFSVLERLDVCNDFDADDRTELRVIAWHSAFSHDVGGPSTCCDASATQSLQFRDSAGVIVVRMGVHDQPDIFDFKAELPDIRGDQRRGFGESAVDKNMTGR